MNEDCEVVFVAGLAKMLGRTEASVREGIRRGADWLPKSFRMGTRHCWLKEDVREYLRKCADGENKASEVGRPRRTPPTLRDIRR
ncbi:hypothetical protein QLG12_15800 [Pseudomonas sp. V88_4]|nr:hypothetical protein [Pseudomonas sp. V88_4]MDI3399678.1 hypothetical protein [Pseudomonas sp. V88_4]